MRMMLVWAFIGFISLIPAEDCRWEGTAPLCDGSCRAGWKRSTPPQGSDSGSACWTGSKVYCCRDIPKPDYPSFGPPSEPSVCPYGPDDCYRGFVWRQANPNDRVCVTPEVRDQTQQDNARALRHYLPGLPCRYAGYVWREAFPGDKVCVTQETREQVIEDNSRRYQRLACADRLH